MTDAFATIKKQVIVWKDGVQYLIDEDMLDKFFSQPPKDMVEVVRCKDCIYYKEKGYDSHPYCYYFDEPWSPSRGISREPDDYCSKGERKTE